MVIERSIKVKNIIKLAITDKYLFIFTILFYMLISFLEIKEFYFVNLIRNLPDTVPFIFALIKYICYVLIYSLGFSIIVILNINIINANRWDFRTIIHETKKFITLAIFITVLSSISVSQLFDYLAFKTAHLFFPITNHMSVLSYTLVIYIHIFKTIINLELFFIAFTQRNNILNAIKKYILHLISVWEFLLISFMILASSLFYVNIGYIITGYKLKLNYIAYPLAYLIELGEYDIILVYLSSLFEAIILPFIISFILYAFLRSGFCEQEKE